MALRVSLLFCCLLASGCVAPSIPPADLTAENAARAYADRSLRDPELHRFLSRNLGRDPGADWDFEALAWTGFYFHPALGVARAQWATAQAAMRTAAQRPNPNLTLTPGYNFTREAGLSPWMPAVGFDLLLPTANKRELQQAIARADADAARLAVTTTAWQVRSDLRKALADWHAADQRGVALRAQAEAQRVLLRLLEDRHAAGSIAITAVTGSRSALLRAESAAADADGQMLGARAKVAAALGVPVAALEGIRLPAPVLPPALSPAAFEAARTEALHRRADVLAALAKYRSAHAALALEAAKSVPDIHLGPGYQWDQGANKWTLALALELPLFHRNEASIAEATARRTEAAAQFTLVQAQVIAAIDAAVAARQASEIQVTNARKLRAEAQAQQARARQRLDLGATDQVEIQTARLDFFTAESAAVDAENAAALAAGQLEDALQIPFPNLAALTAPSSSHE